MATITILLVSIPAVVASTAIITQFYYLIIAQVEGKIDSGVQTLPGII